MFGVMALGPLEEKETTNGANVSLTTVLLRMVAAGWLHYINMIRNSIF